MYELTGSFICEVRLITEVSSTVQNVSTDWVIYMWSKAHNRPHLLYKMYELTGSFMCEVRLITEVSSTVQNVSTDWVIYMRSKAHNRSLIYCTKCINWLGHLLWSKAHNRGLIYCTKCMNWLGHLLWSKAHNRSLIYCTKCINWLGHLLWSKAHNRCVIFFMKCMNWLGHLLWNKAHNRGLIYCTKCMNWLKPKADDSSPQTMLFGIQCQLLFFFFFFLLFQCYGFIWDVIWEGKLPPRLTDVYNGSRGNLSQYELNLIGHGERGFMCCFARDTGNTPEHDQFENSNQQFNMCTRLHG